MTIGTKESCTCDICRRACLNPGWFSPDEAASVLHAGLAHKLMKDWIEPCEQVGNAERIYILAPASLGHEGKNAPELDDFFLYRIIGWNKGQCTFLNNGRCDIHNSGFKPLQCRGFFHGESIDNYTMAKLWDNTTARAIVDVWEWLVK